MVEVEVGVGVGVVVGVVVVVEVEVEVVVGVMVEVEVEVGVGVVVGVMVEVEVGVGVEVEVGVEMSDDICPTCNGRSWVVAWTKHNGRAHPDKASRCPDCPRDPRQELLEAGAPERHLDNWLGVWDAVWRARPMWASLWLDWVCNGGELPPQVEVASGVYAGNGNRRILTLTGDPGTGKSMIAAKLAHRWLKEGNRGVIWAPAAPAFDRVQRERLEDGHSAYERRMMAADFLVLDEIRFMRRDPTTAQTTFYGWVFDRHDGPGVTILTSNLPLHILAGDEALFDRLSGGVWAELKGKSYRNRRKA